MSCAIKRFVKSLLETLRITHEYHRDSMMYRRHNYNASSCPSKRAQEAKIARQAHILEKGMSLPDPRPCFGTQKACELLDYIDQYSERYAPEESSAVVNSLYVLRAYLAFHDERGFHPEDLHERLSSYGGILQDGDEGYGVRVIMREALLRLAHGDFAQFFASRHSIRQFSSERITPFEVRRAVELAQAAPSACNRQSVRVHFYENEDVNRRIGDFIPGNTGFANEACSYLVVTSCISAFHDAFERNQAYVDGGIFALALVESLHYYGIATCILQNGELWRRDCELRKVCNDIECDERVVVFIAAGHYRDEVQFAASHRMGVDDILISTT